MLKKGIKCTLKRKAAIVAAFLLLVCGQSYAQQSLFHLDSVLNFGEIPILKRHIREIAAIKSKGDTMLLSYILGNKFNLYEYNHEQKRVLKSSYKLKGKYEKQMAPSDVVVSDEFIYVLISDKVICLSRKKKKEVHSFSCVYSKYLFLNDTNLIVGFYYNNHPLDYPHKAGLFKFNLRGDLLDSIFLKVPFPEYTHYRPRELISFNGKEYIFGLFDGLNFIAVNTNFKIIDTISIPLDLIDSNWVKPSKSLSESFANNMSDLSLYWSILDESNYHKISRIEHIEFTSLDKLLVRWFSYDSTVNHVKRYTTNLIKVNDSWQSDSIVNLETPIPFNTDLLLYQGGMPLLSANCLMSYTNNYIYQVKIDIPYIENITYKEYYKKRKEKAKKLNPIVSLLVYEYN